MAADPQLPRPQSAVIDSRDWATTEWYEFWRQLLEFARENGGTQEQLAAIEARLAEIEADLGSASIVGLNSIFVTGTLADGSVQIQLDGDVQSPGNTYYYGTGPTGVKGFFTVASAFTATQDGIELVTGSNGVTDIRPDDDLEALEALASTGLAARTGSNAWALRTIQDGAGVVWTNPGGVAGNPQATFDADTGEVAHLPGATYKTVQKTIDLMLSPGIITGGEVTELTSTSVRITAGTALVRIVDDNVSELRFLNFAQQDFSVPDVQVTHFYALDYNGGSPIIVESTVTENWDRDTQIPLGSALRGNGLLNVTPNPYRVGDVITNLIQRLDAIGPVQRDNSIGGLSLGVAGTRNVTVSAGRLWSRVSDFTVTAKNSSVNTMATVYFNGTNLTVTSGITQWDNLNFNNLGTGSLQLMGNNKYANLWFFMSFDGTKYGFAYGTNEYNTLGDAANEGVPSYLTQNFFNQFILLGRFVFQKSAATPSIIESAFVTPFSSAAINTHNNLGGLQGGAPGEYYHLTAAQYATVNNALSFASAMSIASLRP
jgi:hypothetical protein